MTAVEMTVTIFLIFSMTKVIPPWVDTWSDGLWILKLWKFGEDWKEFHVSSYDRFIDATDDCMESHYEDDKGDWTNRTFYSELYARKVFDSHPNTKCRCKKDYSNWAYSSMIPILVCLGFTIFVWWREEVGWARIFLLPVTLVGLYSQYRAVKIICIGLGIWPGRNKCDWIKEKEKFTRQTISLEPTTEALPTLLIQVVLLSSELLALVLGSRPSPMVENPVLFPFSFGLTILLTVVGLTHFLKDGPSPLITSEDGYFDGFISIKFAGLFSCIFLWFMAKCLVLVGIIDSFSAHNSGNISITGVRVGRGVGIGVLLWASLAIIPQLIHAVIILAVSTRTKLFSLSINFPSFIITPMFTPFTYKGSSTDNGMFEFCVSKKHSLINILLTILLTPVSMVLFYYEAICKWTYFQSDMYNYLQSDMYNYLQSDIYNYFQSDIYNYFQSEIDDLRNNNETQAADNAQDYFDLETYYQFLLMATVLLPFILFILALIPANLLLKTSECFPCGQKVADKFRKGIKLQKTGIITWEEVKIEELESAGIEMQDVFKEDKMVNEDIDKEKNDDSEVRHFRHLIEEVSKEEGAGDKIIEI